MNLKLELALAVLLTAAVMAGAAADLPPFSSVMELNARCQAYWERTSPRAPAPHAEEFPLFHLARVTGLPVEKIIEALRTEGFKVEDEKMTVRQVAETKGVAPSDAFAAITKHYKQLIKSRCGSSERRKKISERQIPWG